MQPPSGTCNSQSVWMHRVAGPGTPKGNMSARHTARIEQQTAHHIWGVGGRTHLLQPYGEVIMIKSIIVILSRAKLPCQTADKPIPAIKRPTACHRPRCIFSPRRRCTDLEMADRKICRKEAERQSWFFFDREKKRAKLSNYHSQPCVGFTYCFLDGPFFIPAPMLWIKPMQAIVPIP